jgi:hypothetical protein
MAKTKKEQALDMMNNLEHWKSITDKLGTGSPVYTALREFMMSNAPKIYNNQKDEIEDLETSKQRL